MSDLNLLSRREREVFDMIAAGAPPARISFKLNLSVKTVSTYRARILHKLEIKSNAEIATLQSKEALALAADHTLFAAAICAGVAWWTPRGIATGDIRIGDTCYWAALDAHGAPKLDDSTRDALQQALALVRKQAIAA